MNRDESRNDLGGWYRRGHFNARKGGVIGGACQSNGTAADQTNQTQVTDCDFHRGGWAWVTARRRHSIHMSAAYNKLPGSGTSWAACAAVPIAPLTMVV